MGKKRGIIPVVSSKSWQAMLALWLVFALNSTVRELFNRTQVLIADEFSLDSVVLGMMSSAFSIVMGIVPLFWGPWSDRRGIGWRRRYSLIVIGLGYLILTVLTGLLASSVTLLVVLLCLRNMFAGGGETCECSAVVEWWPLEARGFAAGLHHTGYPWGTFLTGLLISAMITWFNGDWRLIFILIPLMGIPIWIFYWFTSSKKNYEKYEKRTLEMGLSPALENAEAPESGAKALLKCVKNVNVVIIACSLIIALFAFFGINFWLNPYLVYIGEMNYSAAAIFSLIYTITGGLGQIIWGRISDFVGRKPCQVICFIGLAVCFMLLPNVTKGAAWLYGIQLGLGFCLNAHFAIGYAYIQDSAPKGCIGSAMSLAMAASALGGFCPSILGAFINMGGGWESAVGYEYGVYFLSAIMVIGAILIFFFTHDTTGKRTGKDFALVSFKSCGIEDRREKK